MSADFAWEDPPTYRPPDIYSTKYFTQYARNQLTKRPGQWGRICRAVPNHVHVELRKRFPEYEFVGVRDQEGTGKRSYTVYARKKEEA